MPCTHLVSLHLETFFSMIKCKSAFSPTYPAFEATLRVRPSLCHADFWHRNLMLIVPRRAGPDVPRTCLVFWLGQALRRASLRGRFHPPRFVQISAWSASPVFASMNLNLPTSLSVIPAFTTSPPDHSGYASVASAFRPSIHHSTRRTMVVRRQRKLVTRAAHKRNGGTVSARQGCCKVEERIARNVEIVLIGHLLDCLLM
ncbi:hypothetical protein NEOLEDRAFT_154877 [Neolentinus lepideus HHB14362 ss-1]|uniref:Uncharacterized protein n=1 Tax=Neolentinus lepideus HHB14362 ss-1 TaxID=1314782 RepID=A0A165TRY3_9AGAM|nr:hypothetical protein NEOLEDRAFT_154877 [Neolentinus lepideus HHB14362 ss-1]